MVNKFTQYNSDKHFYFINSDSQSELVHNITKQITSKIQKEKEKLIKQKIKENFGEDVDLIEEAKKMFPRIKLISNIDGESYFWNDGTKLGYRLISFFHEKDFQQNYNNNEINISTFLKYK